MGHELDKHCVVLEQANDGKLGLEISYALCGNRSCSVIPIILSKIREHIGIRMHALLNEHFKLLHDACVGEISPGLPVMVNDAAYNPVYWAAEARYCMYTGTRAGMNPPNPKLM